LIIVLARPSLESQENYRNAHAWVASILRVVRRFSPLPPLGTHGVGDCLGKIFYPLVQLKEACAVYFPCVIFFQAATV
jgi:hypothetical protein